MSEDVIATMTARIARLEAEAREREDELAATRAEVRALRDRHAEREREFRGELRAMAARCASVAATSSVAAAVASSVAVTAGDGREGGARRRAEASDDAGGEGEAPVPAPAAVRKPPTAWEVPNAWPPEESSLRATQARERAIAEENAKRAERERGRVSRRRGEAFAGDLSAFFFKTAKHEAPVWVSKSEKADAFASEVLDAARQMNEYDDDSMFRDVEDDSSRDDSLLNAQMTDPVEYPSAFPPPGGLSIEVPRDDDRDDENIPDIGDDDGDLVTALLEGGERGERAAEILAERLRAVGFDFHEPAQEAI